MPVSIKDILEKCKGAARLVEREDIFTALIIILVALSSFGLGRLSGTAAGRAPVRIETGGGLSSATGESLSEAGSEMSPMQGGFVASKNGTAYHFPWCSGALRIKEENKIWFETREAAAAAGYRPAKNCDGL